METLNEIDHLQSSVFGRPQPRHGLQLLHWFSHDYVTFNNDSEMVTVRNPKKKAFGFHRFFDNIEEHDGQCNQLLPDQGLPYYEVGNLNKPGSENLPDYVSENHTVHNDDSNIDRIIISLQSDRVLDRIYVTQHDHQRGAFDPERTYRISKGLISIIRNLELDELLEQAGYSLPCPSSIDTLNEMRYLQSSGFGRPRPRHGLHLLHWFAHDYVKFNKNCEMVTVRNPKKKAFGFHRFFDNIEEHDGQCNQLLPDQDLPYYEVGNLNKPGSENLPDYVSENHTVHNDDSNIDRIIISLQSDLVLDRIYVTQHDHHRGAFDPQRTYRISKGLISIIRNLELDELLEQTGYS
ncbi:uncharacterized protein LOC121550619 [Coregonus clupeaformis]|uniref:uncharacterized protein LOC121550619 n=1 Tax=Coregonus clupeaformis TaxID=59861 RepID=UPI001E1C6BB5|nr:uncharacterized protein LOC121550619 [Coregonus clupeaformis]